ncbi:hypothetical protein IMZ48_26635, partial [Candidatus Bathyarchaeota archaeon]|nr:hypothetical protein [Candidatus Bathyarchaeota archaeon]
IRFFTTAFHELLGHGTSKLLCETAPRAYIFNQENLPVIP